jgi:hypothetical protein
MPGLAQNLSFILLGEDKSASKTMDAAAATAEKTTGRIGSAFSKVGGIVGGEFGSVLDQAGAGIDKMGSKAGKLSSGLMVGGGIAAAAGVGLLQFGSAGVQATDQLNQAIKSAGESTTEFADKIDKAVKKGENFDHSAVDTKAALTKLTEATGSTQKALDNMQVVTDLAAAKHISLAEAAGLVARVMAGSGARTLAQYGIVQQKAVDGAKLHAQAQLAVEKSTTTLAAAQLKLTNLQDIDHTKKKLTIQDHIALKAAQDNVTKASDVLKTAQDKLAASQNVGVTKTQAGQKALEELAKKLSGQGSASVNNFGSQVDIMRTKVVDWAEEVSGPVGAVLTGLGPLFTIAGVAVDIYRSKKEAAILAEIASTTATEGAVVATEGETAAMVGLDTAMDANPIGIVAGALGVLALVAGGIALGSTHDLTKATQDYATALATSNGLIDENVQKTAVKALSDAGALKAANALGIDTGLVVQAALGEKGARAELNKEIKTQTDNLNEQVKAAGSSAEAGRAVDLSQRGARQSLKDLSSAVGDSSTALKNAQSTYDTQKKALDEVSGKLAGTAQQFRDLTASIHNVPSRFGIQVSTSGAVTQRGLHNAGGGDMHEGGWTTVGEQGPEKVRLPGGSHVFPSGSGPSGGGLTVVNNVTVNGGADQGKAVIDALIKTFRNGASATEFKRAIGIA